MTEHPRRIVVWLAALIISSTLILKGHDISRKGDVVAFLPQGVATPGSLTVQVRGNCLKPGCYRFASKADLAAVINMTVPGFSSGTPKNREMFRMLESGNTVSLLVNDGKNIAISIGEMSVGEEMILGIPLDLNRMTISDWEELPGVGPATAKNIVAYRQKNGGLASVVDLKKVSGIGDVKVKQIGRIIESGLIY